MYKFILKEIIIITNYFNLYYFWSIQLLSSLKVVYKKTCFSLLLFVLVLEMKQNLWNELWSSKKIDNSVLGKYKF